MKKAELEVAAEMIAEAGDAVELMLSQGIQVAMNKYNRRERQQDEPPRFRRGYRSVRLDWNR